VQVNPNSISTSDDPTMVTATVPMITPVSTKCPAIEHNTEYYFTFLRGDESVTVIAAGSKIIAYSTKSLKEFISTQSDELKARIQFLFAFTEEESNHVMEGIKVLRVGIMEHKFSMEQLFDLTVREILNLSRSDKIFMKITIDTIEKRGQSLLVF